MGGLVRCRTVTVAICYSRKLIRSRSRSSLPTALRNRAKFTFTYLLTKNWQYCHFHAEMVKFVKSGSAPKSNGLLPVRCTSRTSNRFHKYMYFSTTSWVLNKVCCISPSRDEFFFKFLYPHPYRNDFQNLTVTFSLSLFYIYGKIWHATKWNAERGGSGGWQFADL